MRANRIKVVGAVLAPVFAVVGVLFLLIPGRVVALFNRVSAPWGLPPAPDGETGLFVLLAAAYMAVVTALAVIMARRPQDLLAPRLLALAKLASSVFSLGFILLRANYFIVLVNGVVDAIIGNIVLWLVLPPKKREDVPS
jgi:hypothetical protein